MTFMILTSVKSMSLNPGQYSGWPLDLFSRGPSRRSGGGSLASFPCEGLKTLGFWAAVMLRDILALQALLFRISSHGL